MKTEIERYVARFRRKYVPKRYNQMYMLDYLTDNDVDHYISISNRADGKSYNYTHFFMRFAIDFNIKFILIARHYTIQNLYVDELKEIAMTFSKSINPENLLFKNTQMYIKVMYKDGKNVKTIGLITDLNEAGDLKYDSAFLSNFPIIIFDEFLVLETDYLPDEFERLQTIYSSINRKDDIPIIHFPKLFYLGNAVNFSSPILIGLDLFDKISNQPLNSIKKYDNKVLEINKNEQANEKRNTRAFSESHDNLANVTFSTNNYLIANEEMRRQLKVYGEHLYVKLENNFLRIDFVWDKEIFVLSLVGFAEKYDYNLKKSDTRSDSIFLKESYFDENQVHKFQKEWYYFANPATRYFVLNNNDVLHLKINRLVAEKHAENKKDDDYNEKKFQDNYIADTKKSLLRKFLNE